MQSFSRKPVMCFQPQGTLIEIDQLSRFGSNGNNGFLCQRERIGNKFEKLRFIKSTLFSASPEP